jgi:hypothetical protein
MSPGLGGYNRERHRGNRRYKRRVIIATEGTVSEPRYFDLLQGETTTVQVACVKKNHQSLPAHVLACMQQHLSRNPLDRGDEAWLVVDKDQWSDEQLQELHCWTTKKDTYHFALSNPKFEYWLLLHFEDGHVIHHAGMVDERLQQHVPQYKKKPGCSTLYQRAHQRCGDQSKNKRSSPEQRLAAFHWNDGVPHHRSDPSRLTHSFAANI